jgi:hypothetical protein
VNHMCPLVTRAQLMQIDLGVPPVRVHRVGVSTRRVAQPERELAVAGADRAPQVVLARRLTEELLDEYAAPFLPDHPQDVQRNLNHLRRRRLPAGRDPHGAMGVAPLCEAFGYMYAPRWSSQKDIMYSPSRLGCFGRWRPVGHRPRYGFARIEQRGSAVSGHRQ